MLIKEVTQKICDVVLAIYLCTTIVVAFVLLLHMIFSNVIGYVWGH